MGTIKYIFEASKKIDYQPTLAISATLSNDNHGLIISKIASGEPLTDNYWTDWGGTYDMPTTSQLELFFSGFLVRTYELSVFFATENSFYIDGSDVYINTDYYPWQYNDRNTNTFQVDGYQSSVADTSKPSDIRYDVNGVLVPYPSRLYVPSSTLKNSLSDIISGIILYKTWSVSLKNSDGRFDSEEESSFFNTPARLKKTAVDIPTIDDYQVVRYGFVDNIDNDGNNLTIKVADVNRTLDDSVCRVFTSTDYPGGNDNIFDKNIPIAYGNILGADLFEVGTDQYIVCDPAYLTSVTTVYNGDDESIDFIVDYSTGIITITETTLDIGAETCDFTGLTDYTIGGIITKEVEEKANIAYREGPWDKTESDWYVTNSAKINLLYDGDSVKDLIKTCLECDNAFLINKNDGMLSLRQWGKTYDSHTIPSWTLTQKPKKTHIDSKYFMSSCKVNYLYNYGTSNYDGSYLDNSEEADIIDALNKQNRQSFDTLLATETEAIDLAGRLLDRFKDRRELWDVATSKDTANINPLDTVSLDITVNSRVLSTVTTWIVREVNPAQDTLLLEEAV